MKDIKIFVKETKNNNTVVNATKISQKMKTINWLSIKKDIIEWKKKHLF